MSASEDGGLDRRRFVGLALTMVGSAALAGCASLVALRVPVEGGRVRLVPGEHPGLAGPRGFLRIQPVGLADPVLVLAREGGGYDAVSPVCTHKECIVNAEGGLLVCPCHGSTYDRQGTVLEGPAERPLRRFRTRTEDGVLVIDLTETG